MSTTIEELETTNEELSSANEEFQSTNEELETSKEELQSLNEELETVNAELQTQGGRTRPRQQRPQNLLDSTQIATIFLDTELRITNFTPAISAVVPLRPSDVGRPLADLAQRFVDVDLVGEARDVLRTLGWQERSLRTTAGDRRYLLRLGPYRTVANVIDGVVLTFIDVTALQQAEEAAHAAQVYAESIVDTVRDTPAGPRYEPARALGESVVLRPLPGHTPRRRRAACSTRWASANGTFPRCAESWQRCWRSTRPSRTLRWITTSPPSGQRRCS